MDYAVSEVLKNRELLFSCQKAGLLFIKQEELKGFSNLPGWKLWKPYQFVRKNRKSVWRFLGFFWRNHKSVWQNHESVWHFQQFFWLIATFFWLFATFFWLICESVGRNCESVGRNWESVGSFFGFSDQSRKSTGGVSFCWTIWLWLGFYLNGMHYLRRLPWPRNLPHRDKEGLIQFVTFRLADSLQQEIIQQIESKTLNNSR